MFQIHDWLEKLSEEYQTLFKYYVTFGVGYKGKNVGKGQLHNLGLPCLNDLSLVDCFTTNLNNISQLCDQVLSVMFISEECITTNNNYMWSFPNQNHPQSCLICEVERAKQ